MDFLFLIKFQFEKKKRIKHLYKQFTNKNEFLVSWNYWLIFAVAEYGSFLIFDD
jgi:hypothetical protein